MRLLFVTPGLLQCGGIPLCSRFAIQALREVAGPADEVYVVSQMDTTDALAAAVGGPCYGAGGSRLRMGWMLLRLINCGRWDCVLIMHVNLARILLLCLHLPPTLVMLHGIDVWRPLPWAIRRGLRRVDRLVSVSEHTCRQAKLFNPWMAILSHEVCHLGIPPLPESATTDCRSPEQRPYVLSVGRMVGAERYKGFDELIAVWPRVQRIRPELKLVLIGDGPDRPRLEAAARRGGGDIHFLGGVTDATRDRYLRHCACFALVSRGEGFGLVYLEAMRLGRPVLAGSSDAGAEVIPDGIAGRVVDPVNQEQLLEGLLDVTGPNADAYGAAGRRRFFDLFTYSHFRDRLVRLVGGVLARHEPQTLERPF